MTFTEPLFATSALSCHMTPTIKYTPAYQGSPCPPCLGLNDHNDSIFFLSDVQVMCFAPTS